MGVNYPYLMLSENIAIDSGSYPVVSLLIYMVISGVDVLSDVFPMPLGLTIPTNDPYALKRTRGEQSKMMKSIAQVAVERNRAGASNQGMSEQVGCSKSHGRSN